MALPAAEEEATKTTAWTTFKTKFIEKIAEMVALTVVAGISLIFHVQENARAEAGWTSIQAAVHPAQDEIMTLRDEVDKQREVLIELLAADERRRMQNGEEAPAHPPPEGRHRPPHAPPPAAHPTPAPPQPPPLAPEQPAQSQARADRRALLEQLRAQPLPKFEAQRLPKTLDEARAMQKAH
jgi:hypothetical protein